MTDSGKRRFESINDLATNVGGALSTLRAGESVGAYRLKSQLGRGGMGEVWKAWSDVENRHVVIKVLPAELKHVPDELARVRHSFDQVHALQHEHICPVYLLGEDPRAGTYLVLKFVDGVTLAGYRRAFVQRTGDFPLSEVISVLSPVARALDYAHSKRVVHRDIKPDNIMLGDDGSDVQVVDFGLATEIRTSMTRVSKVRMDTSGTYPYMAPEQWRGKHQDARTDQYALGVVAYELLAGRLPFEAPDDFILRQCVLHEAVEHISDLPQHVNDALIQSLAKDRDDRFESCVAFVEAISTSEKQTAPINVNQPATDMPVESMVEDVVEAQVVTSPNLSASHGSNLTRGNSEAQPEAGTVPASSDVSSLRSERENQQIKKSSPTFALERRTAADSDWKELTPTRRWILFLTAITFIALSVWGFGMTRWAAGHHPYWIYLAYVIPPGITLLGAITGSGRFFISVLVVSATGTFLVFFISLANTNISTALTIGVYQGITLTGACAVPGYLLLRFLRKPRPTTGRLVKKERLFDNATSAELIRSSAGDSTLRRPGKSRRVTLALAFILFSCLSVLGMFLTWELTQYSYFVGYAIAPCATLLGALTRSQRLFINSLLISVIFSFLVLAIPVFSDSSYRLWELGVLVEVPTAISEFSGLRELFFTLLIASMQGMAITCLCGIPTFLLMRFLIRSRSFDNGITIQTEQSSNGFSTATASFFGNELIVASLISIFFIGVSAYAEFMTIWKSVFSNPFFFLAYSIAPCVVWLGVLLGSKRTFYTSMFVSFFSILLVINIAFASGLASPRPISTSTRGAHSPDAYEKFMFAQCIGTLQGLALTFACATPAYVLLTYRGPSKTKPTGDPNPRNFDNKMGREAPVKVSPSLKPIAKSNSKVSTRPLRLLSFSIALLLSGLAVWGIIKSGVWFDDGSPKLQPVSGTVRFTDGSPLTHGRIVFETLLGNDASGDASGDILEDGTFTLESLVVKHEDRFVPGDVVEGAMPGTYRVKIYAPDVPEIYAMASTSPLRAEIVAGENMEFVFEIDRDYLTSDARSEEKEVETVTESEKIE